MKKFTLTFVIALLAVVFCFSLAACSDNEIDNGNGNDNDSNTISESVVGNTYIFDKFEFVGEIPTELQGYFNEEAANKMYEKTQIKFAEEGKFSTSSNGGETWEEHNSTYKFENNEVKFYGEEDNAEESRGTLKLSEGKLTIEQKITDGFSMKITFKKN